jgi:hypothetical protein
LTPELLELVKVFGIPTALAIGIFWAGARDIWVYGNRFREMKADRDHYRTHSEELEKDLRASVDTTDKALEAPARRVRGRT